MLRSFGEGAIQTEAPIGDQLPGRPLAPKFRNFNTWRGRTTIETAGQTEVRIRQLRPPLCPSIIDETPVSCAPADRHSRPILRNLAGWLRVTAAANSFPGGVERSLTQKPWRPGNAFTWNQSTSQNFVA
jgi:hypothetical protein